MTRLIEQKLEARQERDKSWLLTALFGGLYDAIDYSGGRLERISIRILAGDTLLTLVAEFPAGYMVAHVGSSDVAGCFIRAYREAQRESLTWREDKYRKNGG